MSPARYIGAFGGTWQVIGPGGMPECAETSRDKARALYLAPWSRWPRPSDPAPKSDAEIPVWNGDAGVWTTLADIGGAS